MPLPSIFIELPIKDRIRILYENGTFIMSVRYYEHKVNLYILHDYFVEVFYNHRKDCIEKVIPMPKTSKRLKFYTDQINLPQGLLD